MKLGKIQLHFKIMSGKQCCIKVNEFNQCTLRQVGWEYIQMVQSDGGIDQIDRLSNIYSTHVHDVFVHWMEYPYSEMVQSTILLAVS